MIDVQPPQMDGPSHPADGPEKITLDTANEGVYVCIMPPIADILKEAIRDSGNSNKKLEALTGVNRNSLGRFMRGCTGLRMDQAELLIEFFGIKLTKGGK